VSTATSPPSTPLPPGPEQLPVAPGVVGRLYRGQTAIDFVGRRKIGAIISGVLLVLTVVSLVGRGLNFGIDFEGGVAWDVPAAEFTVDDAAQVLADNGLDSSEARIQERNSDSGDIIKIQVGDQPQEIRLQLQTAFAEAAGVSPDDVSANSVSSSWGRDITEKALRALVIFLVVVAVFISIRFEWRMAVASILAMIHDVVISVGIYSMFGFLVTPATVIAFLTILGYSLYDTIVVFDRIRENEARFAAHKVPFDDVVNVSMNQVLMRSLNTSLSSILPVLSLLVVGAGIMGATVLSEFALALLVGMVAGVYSSFYVAVPLLAILKAREPQWRANAGRPRALGDDLRALVMGGTPVSRRARATTAGPVADGAVSSPPVVDAGTASGAQTLLTHAPRPRKKKRR
jgi:preprotein translocase subunit SecF